MQASVSTWSVYRCSKQADLLSRALGTWSSVSAAWLETIQRRSLSLVAWLVEPAVLHVCGGGTVAASADLLWLPGLTVFCCYMHAVAWLGKVLYTLGLCLCCKLSSPGSRVCLVGSMLHMMQVLNVFMCIEWAQSHTTVSCLFLQIERRLQHPAV